MNTVVRRARAASLLAGSLILAMAASPVAGAEVRSIGYIPSNVSPSPTTGFALAQTGQVAFTGSDGTVQALYAVGGSSGTLLTIRGQNFGPVQRSPSVNSNGGVAVGQVDGVSLEAVQTSLSGGIALTVRGQNFGAPSGFNDVHLQNDGSFLTSVRKGNTSIGAIYSGITRIMPTSGGSPGGTAITIFGASDIANAPVGRINADGNGNFSFSPSAFESDGTPRNTASDPIYAYRSSSGIKLTINGADFAASSLHDNDSDGDGLAFIAITAATGQKQIIHRDLATRTTISEFAVPAGTVNVALDNVWGTAFSTAGSLSGTAQEIFVADISGGISRVIGVGDALDGSTATALVFDNRGLQHWGDRAELAFYAELADGRRGFFSTLVPAPGTAGLLLLGIAASSRRRRS